MRIVVMGVSGCGKSSLGAALYPPANMVKMRGGAALTDDDRWPWLDRVTSVLRDGGAAIVSCSALRRCYRDHIRAGAGGPVCFLRLSGARDLLAARMATRARRYMPVSLLDSQLAGLEPPGRDEALTLDIPLPPAAMLAAALDYLKGTQP